MRLTDEERVLLLVQDAFEHGALARPGLPKTLTISGRRIPAIRMQSAIFTRHYGEEIADRRDAWLKPLIDRALEIRRNLS